MNFVITIVVLVAIFTFFEVFIYKKQGGRDMHVRKMSNPTPNTSGLTYCEFNEIDSNGYRSRISVRKIDDRRCEIFVSGQGSNIREITSQATPIKLSDSKILESIDTIISDYDMADWKNLLKGGLGLLEQPGCSFRFIRDGETVIVSEHVDVPAGGEVAFENIRKCLDEYIKNEQAV